MCARAPLTPLHARPDLDDTNGIQGLDERRDVLRLESLILLVQLHLRKALQVRTAARRAFVLWMLCCCQHACLLRLQHCPSCLLIECRALAQLGTLLVTGTNLNLENRGLWGVQDAGYPDINIIAEKVAAEGQTRFEDRYRLPIGISVNMTSYSGKLLTAALYNPRLIMVYAQARPALGLRAWQSPP